MIEAFDHFFLSIHHALANPLFTFIFKLITFLGEKGILFFLLAILFMLFPRTRKLGVCLFGAVCCGALITNIILKDTVARIRPFEKFDEYRAWWQAVGAPAEDGFSFPSGHVTAAAAGCTAICLQRGKKWIVPSAIWVFLMMCARNYLMAHYPTDVLAALIIGTASGFISYYITRFIFDFLEKNRGKKWADFCLDFHIDFLDQLFGEKLYGIALEVKDRLSQISLPQIPKVTVPNIPKISSLRKSKNDDYDVDDEDEDEIEDKVEVDDDDDADYQAKPRHSRSHESINIKMPKIPTSKSTYVGKHEKRN